MITYLPTSVEIAGTEYAIRSDYRAALDICAALSDIEMTEDERVYVALYIFYEDFDSIPQENIVEAYEQMRWFIDLGDEPDNRRMPKLVDWEQDFKYIVAPINRVVGTEVRALEYMHWWTFIAAYYEIGDCALAQIVRIRNKLARHETLDKQDRKWYRENKKLVDFKVTYTEAENEIMKQWGGG